MTPQNNCNFRFEYAETTANVSNFKIFPKSKSKINNQNRTRYGLGSYTTHEERQSHGLQFQLIFRFNHLHPLGSVTQNEFNTKNSLYALNRQTDFGFQYFRDRIQQD